MTTITFEALSATIESVRKAEKITKAGLSSLSRDILTYVVESEDVRPVNMLLGKDEKGSFILTPINWRIGVQYFAHFLPFTSNYQSEVKDIAIKGGDRKPLVFNKKNKRKWDEGKAAIEAWLENENNDIWAWQNDNATIEAKPVDYAKQIQQAITKAMDADKGGMDLREVFDAMMGADVSLAEMFITIQNMAGDDKQEAA